MRPLHKFKTHESGIRAFNKSKEMKGELVHLSLSPKKKKIPLETEKPESYPETD